MNIHTVKTPAELGQKAAKQGAELLKAIIAKKGHANIILATGASQFETIQALLNEGIDWSVVTMFHLDEYIGLSDDHPASFKKYLKERFVVSGSRLKEGILCRARC